MSADAMWVFGYGSLIWNPEFAPVERTLATLPAYRRSFCMRSIHHRGTVDAPGLVLALDEAPEALCRGVAFRVAPGQEQETLDALRLRELVSSAYLERRVPLRLDDGRAVEAYAYVIDQSHVQYCRDLSLEDQARIIGDAVGARGRNDEYLFNTSMHLNDLGIGDPELDWLADRVASFKAR